MMPRPWLTRYPLRFQSIRSLALQACDHRNRTGPIVQNRYRIDPSDVLPCRIRIHTVLADPRGMGRQGDDLPIPAGLTRARRQANSRPCSYPNHRKATKRPRNKLHGEIQKRYQQNNYRSFVQRLHGALLTLQPMLCAVVAARTLGGNLGETALSAIPGTRLTQHLHPRLRVGLKQGNRVLFHFLPLQRKYPTTNSGMPHRPHSLRLDQRSDALLNSSHRCPMRTAFLGFTPDQPLIRRRTPGLAYASRLDNPTSE